MHSPYVTLCGDPANFVDPDGRAGINLSDWTKGCIKDAFLMYGGAAVGGAAMVGIGKVLQGVEFVGSTLQGILNVVSSVKSFFTVVKNLFSGSNGIGGIDNVSIGKSEAVGGEMNNHGNNGAKLGTQGITSTSSNVLTNSAEIEWSRITRSDGSFMGNLIWMDGASGLQNGNNVDMFLYYSMRALQLEHKVEISGFLIFDEKNRRYGYFIQDWKGPGNTSDNSYDIPEITTVRGGSLLQMNGIQYKIFASFHTHPDKGANDPDLGGPEDFDNAPSTEDGFYAANRKAPCYVLGTDFISRVRGIEAGEIELNTREKNEYGKTVKWNSDYYKIADITEINMGKFTIIGDRLNKYRKIKGKK